MPYLEPKLFWLDGGSWSAADAWGRLIRAWTFSTDYGRHPSPHKRIERALDADPTMTVLQF